MPFRQAHALVGALVRDSLERQVPWPSSWRPTPTSVTRRWPLLEPGVAVTRRTTPGGAGPGRWPSSWTASVAGSTSTGPVSPACPAARHRRPPSDLGWPSRSSAAALAADSSRWPRGSSTSCSPDGSRVGRIVEVEAYRGADGPGQPRLPGRDGPQRHHVRAPGPALRLFHLRRCTGAPTWSAAPRCGPRRCCSGPSPRWPGWRRCGPPAGGRARARTCAAGRPSCARPSASTGSHDGADLVTGDRGVLLLDDGTPRRRPAQGPRVGLSKATELPVALVGAR